MKPRRAKSIRSMGTSRPCIFFVAFIITLAFPSLLAFADEKSELRHARSVAASGQLLEAESLLQDFIDTYRAGNNVLTAKYLLGQILYRRADYEGAATELSALIEQHPEWEHANRAAHGLAMAQWGMLDYSGAIQTLESLLAAYPRSEAVPGALLWLAEAFYRRSDYINALVRFQQFLSRYPDNTLREHALDSAGWCLEQSGRYDEAIEMREMLLKEFPDTPLKSTAMFCLATDYFKTGNKHLAAKYYMATASEATPLQEEALLRAGLVLAEEGRGQEAIGAMERLLGMDPSPGKARLAKVTLANSHLRNSNYERSEQLLQALLLDAQDTSDRCSLSFQLALAQMGLGRFADAAGRLTALVRQDQCKRLENGSAISLAQCLLSLDQPDRAAQELHLVLDRKEAAERLPDLLFAYACALILSRQFDEAHSVLAELSENEDALLEWPQIHYYDGLSLFWTLHFERATEKFDCFVRETNQKELIPLARFMGANSTLRAGKPAEAVRRYEPLLSERSDGTLATFSRYQSGLANFLQGKYDKASLLLEETAKLDPLSPVAVPAAYFLGLSHMRMDQLEDAAEQFRILLWNDPAFELADGAAFAGGWIQFVSGDYASAGKRFESIPSKFPDSRLADAAHFFTAASYYGRGDFSRAGEKFMNLPLLFPQSPLKAEATLWAGQCKEKMYHTQEAVTLFRQAMQQSDVPRIRAQALYGLGWTEVSLAEREMANAAFFRLIDEYPTSPLLEQAYFWRGRLDFAAGRWNSARESLLELSAGFPSSELADDALFFAARAGRMSSEYRTAIDLYEKLAQRFPQSPLLEQAKIEAAECMIEAGEADTAAREFKLFIENNLDSPLRPLALYDMGRALQRAGKFKEAIEQYRAAAGGETNELAARSHFAIAECFAELDQNGEAVAELFAITRGGFPEGWAERSHLQVARLLERNRQMEEARQIYAAIAATYRNDAAGTVALKAIERLEHDKRRFAAP